MENARYSSSVEDENNDQIACTSNIDNSVSQKAFMYTENTMQRYSLGPVIGEGAFSIVRKARRKKDKFICALKIIEKRETSTNFKNEIEILHKLRHPNCIAFYEWSETSSKVFVAMELVTGGSLLDRIISRGFYSEPDSRLVCKQVASALQFLHSQGIVHRDLKPDNVMLLNQESHTAIKLTDFGLSKFYEAQNSDPLIMSTVCGTPQYISPEVLNVFDGNAHGYGTKMDLYNLGTLMYILLSGTIPFYDKNELTMFEKIKTGNWEFYDANWQNISDSAKDVVKALMKVNPEERISLQTFLEHEWMRDAPDNCGEMG